MFKGQIGLCPSRTTLAGWMILFLASCTFHQRVASLAGICKAATWFNPSTFTEYFKMDLAASAEAAFGRRVLQKVVVT